MKQTMDPKQLAATIAAVMTAMNPGAATEAPALNTNAVPVLDGIEATLYKSKMGKVTLRAKSKTHLISKPDGSTIPVETFVGYLFGPQGELKDAAHRALTLRNMEQEAKFQMELVQKLRAAWNITE